jgi:hypothetical protein
MIKRDISGLSISELRERYAELSIRQSAAADLMNVSLVNRLGDQVFEISSERLR